jgi:hypothetical protein
MESILAHGSSQIGWAFFIPINSDCKKGRGRAKILEKGDSIAKTLKLT